MDKLKDSEYQCVIPFIYDDSLSYYETLCRMKHKINELIEGYNNLSESDKQKLNKDDYIFDIVEKRKLDSNGNFTGTWFGLKPSQANESISGVVELNSKMLKEISINILEVGGSNDGITNNDSIVEQYDKDNNLLFFPSGTFYLESYVPSCKCYGNDSILKLGDYSITLDNSPQHVNSKWQEYIRMNNTTVGLDAGKKMDSINAYGNVAIGHQALRDNEICVRNTAIGNNSQMELTNGYSNTTLGVDTLHYSNVSDRNTMIGATCGKHIGNNTIINRHKYFSDNEDDIAWCEEHFTKYWKDWRQFAGDIHFPNPDICADDPSETTSNVGVGRNALGFATAPTRNVAIGYNALEGGLNANNCVVVGESSCQFGIKHENSVHVGGRNSYLKMESNQDTCVGKSSMEQVIHSDGNTTLGYQTMLGTSNSYDNKPIQNVAIGRQAMALFNGNVSYNVAIGTQALNLVEGNNNIGVGYGALGKLTTGNNNTAIGHNAGNNINSTDYENSTMIGNNSTVNGSNQVQLGNSYTTTYAYGSVQDRSDIRDKADIRECSLGLEFINMIEPIDFKWNYREDYKEIDSEGNVKILENDGSKKRKRYHHGVKAQQIKEVMDKLNIDFGGYQDMSVNGGADVLTIGYTEFIAPLIKAVQELSAQVKELQEFKNNFIISDKIENTDTVTL